MTARIYQRPKNAMQSGKALLDDWILEFAPAEAKLPDPLMGWAGSGMAAARSETTAKIVLVVRRMATPWNACPGKDRSLAAPA